MILTRPAWLRRADAHAERVDIWVQPYLERRHRGEPHPVHDFLFTYYAHRPAALRRWHPGYGVALAEAHEYDGLKGYDAGTVSPAYLASRVPLITSVHTLLSATATRPPTLGCFGLHEWAMAYRSDEPGNEIRHGWPLRLGVGGTDEVVRSHTIGCSHFDAFRFFTPPARALNVLQPGRDDRPAYEQPGCLHAGMDLYKHAFRLSPLVPSELVADCFALAWEIRELDMRASPYDFADLGFSPVMIETPAGKAAYVAAQREFAERGAPLRAQLVAECERLLSASGTA